MRSYFPNRTINDFAYKWFGSCLNDEQQYHKYMEYAGLESELNDDITVKPVCNDHLYDNIYCLWFIQ